MPLVTAGNPAPVTITKYLLPNEKRVITVRKHVAILLRPVAFLVLGLVLAGVLTGFIGVHNGWALLIIWLLWLLALGYFSYQAVQWWVSYFVLANQRCLQTSGLITRRVNMLPLVKVTDVILEQNLRGRVLGYGRADPGIGRYVPGAGQHRLPALPGAALPRDIHADLPVQGGRPGRRLSTPASPGQPTMPTAPARSSRPLPRSAR